MLLVSIFALIGLSCLNWYRLRDPLNPAFLQSTLWALILTTFFTFSDMFYPITTELLAMIVLGALLFSVGVYVATYRFKPDISPAPPISMGDRLWIIDVLLAMSCIGLPFYVRHAINVGLNGPFDDMWVNLRYAVTTDIYSFGLTAYFGTISFCTTGFLLSLETRRVKWRMVLAIGLSLTYAIFSSGRTPLFCLVLMVLGILAIQRRIRPLHAILVFVPVAAATFAFVAVAMLKGGSATATFDENLITVTDSFLGYLLSPLPAFSGEVGAPPPPGLGENTFRFFFALFERLGAPVNAVPLIQEFTDVPMSTNVYTVFQPYFVDFRWPGAMIAMLLLGGVHGFVYERAASRRPYFVFLYGALMYPLFMQFFQDQYMNLLSTWLQIGLITAIVYSVHQRAITPANASRRAPGFQ